MVWIANLYMSLYALIRTDLKKGRILTQIEQQKIQDDESNAEK